MGGNFHSNLLIRISVGGNCRLYVAIFVISSRFQFTLSSSAEKNHRISHYIQRLVLIELCSRYSYSNCEKTFNLSEFECRAIFTRAHCSSIGTDTSRVVRHARLGQYESTNAPTVDHMGMLSNNIALFVIVLCRRLT
jgi:hypothetical protein